VQEKDFRDCDAAARRVLAADALLFASPEYNGRWRAAQNVIDWLSRFQPQPFNNKPAALFSCHHGASRRLQGAVRPAPHSGTAGGSLAGETRVFIGQSASKFTDGKLTDRNDAQVPVRPDGCARGLDQAREAPDRVKEER